MISPKGRTARPGCREAKGSDLDIDIPPEFQDPDTCGTAGSSQQLCAACSWILFLFPEQEPLESPFQQRCPIGATGDAPRGDNLKGWQGQAWGRPLALIKEQLINGKLWAELLGWDGVSGCAGEAEFRERGRAGWEHRWCCGR